MTRGYQQHCPTAVALDELGDRWVLLILRELMLGPQRFTDLRHALPGIAPNLLSERLRTLEDAGLVARTVLEPPAVCRAAPWNRPWSVIPVGARIRGADLPRATRSDREGCTDDVMVAFLRDSGYRVGLLSNSLGTECYEGFDLHNLFDSATISDLEQNIAAAGWLGMGGVVHRDADTTRAELIALFTGTVPA